MSLPCASTGADLMFIVDSLQSIGSNQYENARRFISKMLDELDVGENAFQVAIDIFSDGVEHSLDFVSCRDKANAKRVAELLRYLNSKNRYLICAPNGSGLQLHDSTWNA